MDNVVLECNARGDPFPLVTWTKSTDSVSLTNELKFVFSNKNQTLTIRNVSLDDRGIYICSVNNTYAQDKKNVTVYVEGKYYTKLRRNNKINTICVCLA